MKKRTYLTKNKKLLEKLLDKEALLEKDVKIILSKEIKKIKNKDGE